MKRLRSSDDLTSSGEKSVGKDWGRRDEDSSMSRSSSHRGFYYKSESGRKGSSSSSRYDRLGDDHESSRLIRKRSDYDSDIYDRRKSYDRYRDGSDRGILNSSLRGGYSGDKINRSESFSGFRRDFPKGFRSERDRSRREGSVSSWRRFGAGKDVEEGARTACDSVRGSKVVSVDKGNLRKDVNEGSRTDCDSVRGNKVVSDDKGNLGKDVDEGSRTGGDSVRGCKVVSEEKGNLRKDVNEGSRTGCDSVRGSKVVSNDKGKLRKDDNDSTRTGGDSVRGSKILSYDKGNLRSPQRLKEPKSPPCTRNCGSEQSKSSKVKKSEDSLVESASSSEMEEGELEPEPACESEPEPKPASGSGSEPKSESAQKSKNEPKPTCENEPESKPESAHEPEIKSKSAHGSEPETKLEPPHVIEPESTHESEREPTHESEPSAEDQNSVMLNSAQNEPGSDHQEEYNIVEDGGYGAKSLSGVELHKDSMSEEKLEVIPHEIDKDLMQEVDESLTNSVRGTSGNEDIYETAADEDGSENRKRAKESNSYEKEGRKDTLVGKPMLLEADHGEDKGIDVEVKSEDADLSESNRGVTVGSGAPEIAWHVLMDGVTQNSKDKGKIIAVSSTDVSDPAEVVKVEREPKGLLTWRDDDVVGPSTRGLQLFLSDPIKQPEKPVQSGLKPKDEKLSLEPLELSLSLPDVLLPINSDNMVQAPGSPRHARSGQSFPSTFHTKSDGFTVSMSFSGSRPFMHNPSCSLTHNSFDNYEQSVGSRPLFQGMDQVSPAICHDQPSNEQKCKEVPLYQRVLLNGNGICHQSQASQNISNSPGVEGKQVGVAEESCMVPIELDRQLNLYRQLSRVQSKHQNDVRSPSQSVGSHENGSGYSKDKNWVRREKDNGSLYRNRSQNEKEQFLIGRTDFFEPIITMIVSEPVHLMAKKFNEMTVQSISCLKESVRAIILNVGKHRQLYGFQEALQNRSDITFEMLLKSHHAQLEILVALKTGLQEFLQQNYDISTSELAEIFLNLRCRNLTCRSLLPVDECDCRVCVQKNGFCSSCMCLVCSKFDMASNTCSWVGCDVCLHWCHADCALRESYIRNGRSASGAQGAAEIQFHCVACDHPSEMFGFVKEVFQNFVTAWTAETLSKELEYVRRIFSASEDMRGKRLHDIVVLMVTRLDNKSDLREVQNQIMSFLAESDSFQPGDTPIVSGKELLSKHQEESNVIAGASKEAAWLKPFYSEKACQVDKASSLLPSFDSDQNNKHSLDSDLQRRSAQKEPVFDELESIVRIKQAEANMFQARADDARREAEGLKRIAIAKNKKIEDEYTSRVTKLCLSEAEEMRRQKFEELQALERAYQEYFNMKIRMEADIKDLLSKMEATKRNLTI